MKFIPTELAGAYLVELERRADDRGFFARLFCEREFEAAGLVSRYVQVNNSLSIQQGTLRGLHYQLPGAAEAKLVRCVKGRLFDVIVDLRPQSPTYLRWFGAELNEDNRTMMYVPPGFAHAFLTLSSDVEALYLVSEFYSPTDERGLRWNDPRLSIDWPMSPVEVSAKDAGWPDFDEEFHGVDRMRVLR